MATLADSFLADLDELSDNEADVIMEVFLKQPGVFLSSKKTGKGKRPGKGGNQYFKSISLGFKTLREATEGTYIDKRCPFTGNVSIRGRILAGTCHSAKMNRTIIVRRNYLLYVKKYQRYEKRHSNIPAHISPCVRVKEEIMLLLDSACLYPNCEVQCLEDDSSRFWWWREKSFYQNDEENLDAEQMEEDGDLADIEALNYDDLDNVSKLQKSRRYIDIMQKVEDALEKESDATNKGVVLEDDPEYQLIVDCNALSVDIENEIVIIHNFIRDKYRLKFPELESLVHHPIDYARVVKKIGNEMDLTLVDLEGLLPSAIIMVVSVTASTTSGKPLPEDVLQKTVEACDRALALDSAKKKVLDFVESRMGYIAPNLSAVVGSAVAAKLMGTAGGLSSLAKMPACNVQLLGAKRKNLAGFSTATSQFHVGYIEQTELFQSTPPSLRMRACRLLAAKSTLAARVDSINGDPAGKTGRSLREEIRKKIEKWQEPPPAKQPKPLPVPDSEPKKKRGGRRLRKMKERYAITDMRKLANRMQFGIPEESSLGDGLGEGYGMLGQAGSGKLRVSVGQSKLAAKVAKKFKEKSYGSSGATSGLTSSLAFTPVQGIELSNPQALANQLGSGTQSTYFSDTGTFSKIKRT